MTTHSNVLACRIPGMGEPGRLPSMGLHRVGQDRSDLAAAPTATVTNRFKGSDLIECLMSYEWRLMTLYRRQGSRPSPRKRNAKKAKWFSDKVLQIAEKRR